MSKVILTLNYCFQNVTARTSDSGYWGPRSRAVQGVSCQKKLCEDSAISDNKLEPTTNR